MTLKEWAEREGLDYLDCEEYPPLLDEYDLKEVVYAFRHCLDCSDWYLFRDHHGVVRRLTNHATQHVIVDDESIESLKAENFREEET